MNPSQQPDPQPQDGSTPSDGTPDLARPFGVYVIAAVVAAEALVLAIVAVWSSIDAFSQPSRTISSAVFLIVLLVALAAGLGAVSVNAFKGLRWTRSASFVWQLLMVALGVPALLSGALVIGLAMSVPALLVIYYLFTPKVVAYSLRLTGDTPVL